MSFVYKCLRIKNEKKPISSRCNKAVSGNGVLCKDCLAEAKTKPINVLMCKDVTKGFGIPFKNQVYVQICLNKDANKPEAKNLRTEKERLSKAKLMEELNKFPMDKLKTFHDTLGLALWDMLKETRKDEYAFRYYLTKEVIQELIKKSIL